MVRMSITDEIRTSKSSNEGNDYHLRLSTETSALLPSAKNTSSSSLRLRNFLISSSFAISTFVTMFSLNILPISSTTLILDKVCQIHLGYPDDICRNLNNFSDIKVSAEKMAANYNLAHKLLKIIPAAMFSFVAGPWSDKYGRKLLLQLAVVGSVADPLGACLCSYFEHARLEYYLMAATITGVSGGHVTLTIFYYSYTSDTTTIQKRTMNYALLEILLGISMPLSYVSGGWIYNFYGYTIVFLISTCGLLFSYIWIMLFLPETRGLDNKDSWKVKIGAFFSFQMLVDSLLVTTKKRENNRRRMILLLLISNFLVYSASNSVTEINYLYVHHQFNWGNTEYSTIYALYLTCAIVSLLLLLPLLKRFRTRDPVIGLLGCTSMMAKFTMIGLARKPAIFHVANILGLLGGCTTMALRSMISKVVPENEIGNLFSFAAISEATFPILSNVAITQLFNIFLDIYPGMPYEFIAVSLILPFATFMMVSYATMLLVPKLTQACAGVASMFLAGHLMFNRTIKWDQVDAKVKKQPTPKDVIF